MQKQNEWLSRNETHTIVKEDDFEARNSLRPDAYLLDDLPPSSDDACSDEYESESEPELDSFGNFVAKADKLVISDEK